MSVKATGTFPDGKYARILHDGNRFVVRSVTASDEVSPYLGSSANAGDTVDRWRPFANEVEQPRDLNGSGWTPLRVTVGTDGQTITETTDNASHLMQQSYTFSAVTYVMAAKFKLIGGRKDIRINASDGTNIFVTDTRVEQGDTTDTANVIESSLVFLGDDTYLVRMTFTAAAGAGTLNFYMLDDNRNVTYAGDVTQSIKILETSLHESSASLRYDLYHAQAGDCIAIAAHNLWSSGGRITIEHDSNEDDTWTTIDTLTPADNSPIMFFFDTVTSVRWRISVDRGALPEIGVFRVGSALKFERPFYSGFTVPRMSRNTEVLGNISGSGELLGRSKKRTTLNASYSWSNLTYTWVRANLDGSDGLIQSAEVSPLFVAWRPSETQDVEYLMRASVQAPQAQGVRDLHNFSMSGEVHAYE